MIFVVALVQAVAHANSQCVVPKPNELNCPLKTGASTFWLDAKSTQFLKLTNRSKTPLQLESLQGAGSVGNKGFLEYGVYRNAFATTQSSAGSGEVAALSKNAGTALPGISWGPRGYGLSVLPGESIYVAFNPYTGETAFKVTLKVVAGSHAVEVWRQPRSDEIIRCNGREQTTKWQPWQNLTHKTVFLKGALIYAEGGKDPKGQVDSACVYILDRKRRPSFSSCKGANGRSPPTLAFARQRVAPGEFIAAQAKNTCPAPANWDWAAYLIIRK